MASPPNGTTPAELAALNDYRTRIWGAFQNNYEDRWDQAKWDSALRDFQTRHERAVLEGLRSKKLLPPWDLVEAQLKKGPPPFLRPGWRSPLLGKQVQLDWIDQDAFVWIRGTKDDWRNAKVLVIEFWASWCRPCHKVFPHLSEIAASERDVKVITFANEGIFNNANTDVPALKAFIFARNDMNYPIYVDNNRVAFKALFRPGQNASIPLVFIITVKDRMVRWIGNAEDMSKPLADALASTR